MSTASIAAPVYDRNPDGIFVPTMPIRHRDDEYDPAGFETLITMQRQHFWYQGRHRFLLAAVRRMLARMRPETGAPLAAVDLGGGCGGWIDYLQRRAPGLFGELALADSSLDALARASDVVGENASRFQIDLLRLDWTSRWDAAFLLDVLEHIPEDLEALRQVRKSLRPGGLLFVTTPALKRFWTYNDELSHHVRRYSRADFADLARQADLELVDARYFMFLLSPLLYLSRRRPPELANMTPEEIREHLQHTHRVPAWPVNQALRFVFSLETPAGHWLRFPWGTSILGVFRKPGGLKWT